MKNRITVILVLTIGLNAAGTTHSWGQSLKKAEACFLRGDWNGRLKELQGYVVAHPKDLKVLYEYSYALYLQKRYPEAIKAYSNLINLDPNDPSGWEGRAEAYFKTGRYLEALHDCDKALKLESNFSEFWRLRAETNDKLGKTVNAIEDITHAINCKYRANFFEDLTYRARLYRKRGQYELAVADCSRVLSLWTTDQTALEERAKNYDLLGKHEEAKEDREELADVKAHTVAVGAPTNIILDSKSGRVIAAGTSPVKKSNTTKQKLPPQDNTPNIVPKGLNQKQYYKLARTYGWERWEQTLDCIKKINAIDAKTELAAKANRLLDIVLPKHMPPPSEAVALSIQSMDCISDHDKSRKLSEACVKRYPNFEYGYISLGALEKDVGNKSAARANFEKALEINPHNLEGLSRLGDILRDIDEEQAKVVLRRAVTLDPDDSFDRYILYLLEGSDHQ